MASMQAKPLRRDCTAEAYLGLCYGRTSSPRASQLDGTFVAYLSRWPEARHV